MSFNFEKGIPIQTPPTRQKRSLLQRAGEFLVPTTTGVITGLREGQRPTGRQVVGSALEIGSFAVPAGAIAKSVGLIRRGTQAAKGIKVAEKTQLEKFKGGISEIGQVAKSSAEIGGISGALSGAGRALGEEDKSLTQVTGEAAIGGGIGVISGVTLGLGGNLIIRSIKGIKDASTRGFRAINNQLNPTDRTQAVDDVSKSILDSYVEDKGAIFKGLDKIAEGSRFTGDDITPDLLIREMIDEGGYIPKIRGEIGRFADNIKDANVRRSEIRKIVTDRASRLVEQTPIQDLKRVAQENLSGRTDVDVLKAQRQLDTLFKGFQKAFGNILNPTQVNNIREKMNQQGGESFTKVVQNSIGRATRSTLDKFDIEIRNLNAESGRLARITDTMKVLDNKKIDAGFWGNSMGRYIGTVFGGGALGAISLGAGAVGGGLVVAGILANVGSKAVANIIRQTRFNPQLQKILREGLRSDKKLMERLIKESNESDKSLLNRLLLREPAIELPARGQRLEPKIEIKPAKKGPIGVDPKTGRFKKTFLSI